MKKILLFLIISAILFLPIYDIVYYNYDYAETEVSKIVDEYAENNFGKSVSVMKYRQTTEGIKWTVKFSTDQNLVGAVLPIWIVSPRFLRDDVKYAGNSFLYREIIVVTDKKETIHKFSYAGENFSVIFPQRIIIATPNEEMGEMYRICDLSIIGIVIVYLKLSIICIGIFFIIKKLIVFLGTGRQH